MGASIERAEFHLHIVSLSQRYLDARRHQWRRGQAVASRVAVQSARCFTISLAPGLAQSHPRSASETRWREVAWAVVPHRLRPLRPIDGE
jgi:hypothetical protein